MYVVHVTCYMSIQNHMLEADLINVFESEKTKLDIFNECDRERCSPQFWGNNNTTYVAYISLLRSSMDALSSVKTCDGDDSNKYTCVSIAHANLFIMCIHMPFNGALHCTVKRLSVRLFAWLVLTHALRTLLYLNANEEDDSLNTRETKRNFQDLYQSFYAQSNIAFDKRVGVRIKWKIEDCDRMLKLHSCTSDGTQNTLLLPWSI